MAQKCKAINRAGQQCRAWAINGKGVCKAHGGMTPGGVLHPQYKGGRYSRYLPERLLERYEEAYADSEHLSHQEDIALVDARVSDLLSRTGEGEAGSLWREMKICYKALQVAINQRNSQSVLSILATMEGVLEEGNRDWLAWDEIKEMLELRRRLAESERKRLIAMQQVVRIEEVTTLVMVIADIIRRNVDDPKVQMKVINELNRLLTISRQPAPVQQQGAGHGGMV